MTDVAHASLMLASVILLAATLLGLRERGERRDRSNHLSPEDARHFYHQDRRRLTGLVVMAVLAVALVVGSSLPHKVAGKSNPAFLATWLGIFVLILFLLTLALIDWVALRLFARRHRNLMLRERLELLQEEKRRRNSGNGHGDGPLHDLFGESP